MIPQASQAGVSWGGWHQLIANLRDVEQRVWGGGGAITLSPSMPFCPWLPAGQPGAPCPAPAPTANTRPKGTQSSHSAPRAPQLEPGSFFCVHHDT